MIGIPGPAFVMRQFARAAARRRDWPRAAAIYARMARMGIGNAGDRVRQGHAEKEAKEIDRAAATYRAAAARYPLDLNAQRQHGLFLRHHGSADEAVTVLARALALAPGADDIRAELAELGFAGYALEERMIAGLLGGSGAPGHAAFAARGEALLAKGDPAGAVAAIRQALLRAPRSPASYVLLGHALAADGRARAAVHAHLAAWRLRPGHAGAGAALAAAGWRTDDLARLTERSWGHADPAAPEGLSLRERAIWAHLAHATGHGN